MINFPQSLLNQLKKLPHFDENAFLEAHAAERLVTSIRLNPFKPAKLDFELSNPVPWNQHAYYLNERPYFTHDPMFHAGAYYVQEAGSMFIEQALSQSLNLTDDLKILDLCAAPGGKSTLINTLISKNSLLVANEIVKSRADVLAQNLSRWGTSNTVVTNNHPDKFMVLKDYFDAIVVDAPCSGSGLFRKQPEAINEWSEQAVAACELRQKNILENILPTLKNDGILVYSTCSYSIEENENIVNWLISEQGMTYVPIKINAEWGIQENAQGYRFYPHLAMSEGFFCAVLRRENVQNKHTKTHKFKSNISKQEIDVTHEFIDSSYLTLNKINGRIHLMNQEGFDFLNQHEKNFYYKKAGTLIGEIKNGKLVPEQELAWCTALNNNINRIDLEKEEAIQFLKKENFQHKSNLQGLVLFSYKNLGLAWAKILSNRVNNYLPNEIKILR